MKLPTPKQLELATKKLGLPKLAEMLGDFFRSQGTDMTFSKGQIAGIMEGLYRKAMNLDPKIEYPVTEDMVRNCITYARKYLESEHAATIISVMKAGYKLATPKEATIYGARCFKRLISGAERTERIMPLVKRQYLPEKLKKSIVQAMKGIHCLTHKSATFMLDFQEAKK